MKITCSSLLLASFLSADVTVAFAPPRSSTRSTTSLALTPDQIKQHGSGIPVVPSGNKELFDPAKEGRLQGTGSLDDRILSGSDYQYLATVTPTPEISQVLDDAQRWLEDIGTPPPTFAKATQPATARVLGRARTFEMICASSCFSFVSPEISLRELQPLLTRPYLIMFMSPHHRFDCS